MAEISDLIQHSTDAFARMPTYQDRRAQQQQIEAAQQEMQLRSTQMADHQRALDEAVQRAALEKRVGGMVATGDFNGADNVALGAAAFDLHGHVRGVQGEQTARRAEAGAKVAFGLQGRPYEERRAIIQAAAPQLVAAGWKPEEIAAYDPTDQNNAELMRSAQTIKEAYAQRDNEREFGLKQQQADEEARANRAREGKPIIIPVGAKIAGADGYELPGTTGAPAAGGGTAPGGFDHAVNTVLHNEGGYNPSDMNGAPVNFGINQKANPGVDVKSLTREQAVQIYHDKYWVPSGAENLPANMQTPYFDVYIRNPGAAKRALATSGGDPVKFMASSSAYFQQLAQRPSGQPYAKAWAARDANNTALASGGGGSRVLASNPKPVETQSILDQPTRALMADQYLSGDKSVLANLGRGTQGAKNIVLLRQEIASQARDRGMSGADIAKVMAQFSGLTASARTIGNIGGKVDYGVNELLQSIPLAQSSSDALPRGQFVPLTRIQQMIQRGTASPELKDFAIKTNAVINAYNLVAGRAGTDVEQRRHNASLLQTADSPQAYKAALAAMATEGKVAQSASRTTMDEIGGKGDLPTLSPAQARNAPKGTKFRTTDGRTMVRH